MSSHPILPSLVGLSKEALLREFELIAEKPFRAQQIWQWLYVKGVSDFSAMTNLSKPLRDKLAEKFSLRRPEIVTEQCSVDGTRKWLLRLADNQEVEMVFIPDEERGTLCVSSQVGCTLTCDFCHTGTQKMVRNLTAAEIVGQLCLARDCLSDWGKIDEKRSITNIVLMGMGEPLFNYDNVAAALKIMMDGEGISISRRKITLSTAGVVPLIPKVGEEIGVGLAISLHAVRDDLRNILVPLNKKYPLAELMEACRAYPSVRNARRITFEYVMLDSVNDTDRDAKELVRLIEGIPAKINLIPFNPWPGTKYKCSSPERINRFAEIVMAAGYPAPIRTPRGQDILAACGQLKSESVRLSKAARLEADAKQ